MSLKRVALGMLLMFLVPASPAAAAPIDGCHSLPDEPIPWPDHEAKPTPLPCQGMFAYGFKRAFVSAGVVRFAANCEGADGNNRAANFAVIPEDGDQLIFPPTPETTYTTDGFWFRHHPKVNEWYKIPDGSEVKVSCPGAADMKVRGITPLVYVAFGLPDWTDDAPKSSRPASW